MITAVLCLLLILFVYVALRKPEIFNEPSAAGFIEQKIIHAVNMGQGKALKPPTPEQEMILQKLTDFVEGDSLYIDPDIDQKKVASLLNIPVHKLSKAMVDCWGKSFSAYINELRVEKVKELLRSEQYKHYTIAAISREAGFNNESLFYRVFKKHTGQTPVLFQRNTP
jgi:YesN/AraC family two-component response regulator